MLQTAFAVEQGAYTSLFAAADPVVWREKSKYGGAYLVPYGVIAEVSEDAKNADLAKELWATSEKVISAALSK